MNSRPSVSLALLIASAAINGGNALAFTIGNTCNGNIRWNASQTNQVSLTYDTCSYPTGSTQQTALASAWLNWNQVYDGILGSPTPKAWNCWETNGDGQNEVMMVTQATLGNNINAVTLQRWSTCFFSAATYTESDILSSVALSYSPEDESFWNWSNAQQGPVVLAHEMGHFIGLGHAEGFDIMRAATPEPLAGGNTSEPYGDDANGARYIYPGFLDWHTNLFASAQEDVGNVIQATNILGTVNVCRGNIISVTYTVGNNGNLAVNNVSFRIYLSTSPVVYSGGTNMWSGTANSNPGNQFTETRQLTIPNVPNGFYWIMWQVGFGSGESITTDNAVHGPMTISVGC